MAGKSTLNRLEHAPEEGPAFTSGRYHKISHDAGEIESLFVTLFLEAHATPPERIILDLDATDDPLHGHQEGRFFHGYYDCYCYLPLYVFCGRHLLAAKLRRSNIDASAGAVEETARIVAQIRERWPQVQIVLRADSGFAREALMAWCEDNGVDYVFGLARNDRLVARIRRQLKAAEREAATTRAPARRFRDFMWRTLDSWSHKRRVIGKAEWTRGEANPRFIVTSLDASQGSAAFLYEDVYCARGDMENRIKECQLDLDGRPHAGHHHARQPAAAVARIDGLRAPVRAAPHRPCRNRAGSGDLRHHPPQAAENRRAGDGERATRQVRPALGLPAPGHLRRRLHPASIRRGLRPPDPSAQQQNRKNPSHVQSAAAVTTALVWRLAGVINPCKYTYSLPAVRKTG